MGLHYERYGFESWKSNLLLKETWLWAAVVALRQSTCLQSKTLEVVGSILAGCWAFFLPSLSLSSLSSIRSLKEVQL